MAIGVQWGRRFARSLANLVYPPQCRLCQASLETAVGAADGFCASCAASIREERRLLACPTCGSIVAPFAVSAGRCGWCRNRPKRIDGTVVVGPYGIRLGHLLRTYKYRRRHELGEQMGEWLAELIDAAPWRERPEAVVAVPTHWRRRLSRSFHAAEHLASVIADRIGLPNLALLRRVRAGRHQIGLSYTERAKNVRGAFATRKGVTLCDTRLLLVDDVKTSGATIEECAKVLRRAGAAEVYAAIPVVAGAKDKSA